jgi:MFS transporter, YQGE family, putative transporter
MLKNFSKNEKLFLLHNFVITFPLSISNIFISFYIWEKTSSLVIVCMFYIFNTIGLIVGDFVSSFVSNFIKGSYLRAGGIVLTGLSIGVIFILGDNAIQFLIPIGFFFGIATGIRALAYKFLFIRVIQPSNREGFMNVDNTVTSFIAIVIPLVAAFFVGSSSNYSALFGFAFLTYMIAAFPLLFIKNLQFQKSKFEVIAAFKTIKADPDLRKLSWSKSLDGIKIGIQTSIWGIIVLNIVGNLQNWGIYNTIFAVIATIISYTLGKKVTFSNSKQFAVFMGAIMTIVGLLFASEFNLPFYIIYSFIASITETLFFTGSQSIESKIIDRNVMNSEIVDETYLLLEIPTNLGRILPLLLIVFTNSDFNNDLILRVFIILVAAVPLLISSLLSNVNVAKRSFDPFVSN